MKQRLWRGMKFIILITIPLYFGYRIQSVLIWFWTSFFALFFSYEAIAIPAFFISLASIAITFATLYVIGFFLEQRAVRHLLDIIASHLPLVRYVWSVGEDTRFYERFTPVLFQHPMPGEWKVGFIMGDQKSDDGEEYYKIFFVTGVGDHEFIEKKRTDLFKPLSNSPPEILQYIASFMTAGPAVLHKKQ